MGWFTNLSANRKIIGRLSDIEEDLETIKRRVKGLDLEFSELYDKTRHALGRMAKRARVVESQQDPEEEASGPLPEAPSDGLTPGQHQWNQRILAARMMRGSVHDR